MEAPPLVEVEDLACSPAGSLETGSPSVYSELGTASSPSEASPVDITSQKPVLLRASREAPYVGLGAYTKRAAEAAARRRHQNRRPRYRTARPDAADDAFRAFAGRAKKAATADKPRDLTVLTVGERARVNLHVSVALPTRTPSTGPATGFSDESSSDEEVVSVKRPATKDTAASPAPWRSPLSESPRTLRSPAVSQTAARQTVVEASKQSIKAAMALGDADALKARTPALDEPSNFIADVEAAEERYRAKEHDFERTRMEFEFDLPPGALAVPEPSPGPSPPPRTRLPPPTTRSPPPRTRSPPPTTRSPPPRARSPERRQERVSTRSFCCQADDENAPSGRVLLPTSEKLPASRRRARDLLARQEHAAQALRALAYLENADDSDDGAGDEGLIFDEHAGGLSFLHVSDVSGVRPAADVAASAAEHALIERAAAGPETCSPKLRGDASPEEPVKMLTPRGTLRERLEQMEAFADQLEVELDQGRERIEGFATQYREKQLNSMVLPSPRSPPPPPPKSLASLASPLPPPPETASIERHAQADVKGAWGAYEELAAALESPSPVRGIAHRTGAPRPARRRPKPKFKPRPFGRDIW